MTDELRIVLDTNALISILSRKLSLDHILIALKNGEFSLYVTTEILLEYQEKIIQFYDENLLNGLIYLFEILPNVNQIKTYYNLALISIDPSDNKFVDCAFACNATYIVTNDKHFNILKDVDYPKINVITIEEFSTVLKKL